MPNTSISNKNGQSQKTLETAHQKIDAILELQPKYVDLSLTRLKRLLNSLGNPQLHLPPVIHIAGTNGKGSASAFARSFLEAEGKVVHVHTSPHLVNWTERFRIGRKTKNGLTSSYIDDTQLAKTLEEVTKANNNQDITIFEILTATAFVLFARIPADAVILEVGLGGRCDATNIIEKVAVSLIMPISMDHESFLGNNIKKIAQEKAGIIKKHCPVVSALQQDKQVTEILQQTADQNQAPLSLYQRDYNITAAEHYLHFQNNFMQYDLPYPALNGLYQSTNAAAALQAVLTADFNISQKAAKQAMTKVAWPARLQNLKSGNLRSYISRDADLWLDGGHNPAAAKVIVESLKNKIANRPFFLICGMLTTKDAQHYLQEFKSLAPVIYTVAINNVEQSFQAKDLSNEAKKIELESQSSSSIKEALSAINQSPKSKAKPPFILICGSLYLAGQALAENGTPPK